MCGGDESFVTDCDYDCAQDDSQGATVPAAARSQADGLGRKGGRVKVSCRVLVSAHAEMIIMCLTNAPPT